MQQPVPLVQHRREALNNPVPGMPPKGARVSLRILIALTGKRCSTVNADAFRAHQGRLIVALNHLNNYEALFTPTSLIYLRNGQPVRFLFDWMFAYIPLFGWWVRSSGMIPVWHKRAKVPLLNRFRKKDTRKRPLDVAREELLRGGMVGFYPEGSRNHDPSQLRRGRMGLARLALETATPVLPVGVDYEGRQEGKPVPMFPKLILRFGEILHFDDERTRLEGGDVAAAERRDVERQATRRIMEMIGALSGKRPAEGGDASAGRVEWSESA